MYIVGQLYCMMYLLIMFIIYIICFNIVILRLYVLEIKRKNIFCLVEGLFRDIGYKFNYSIYCFIKLVLNNLYFFNMFIQFKWFFFLDDIDIFNILEEIGMKEYKNVFKENMVRKN